MARYDDLNVSQIAIVAVISVVVTAVTALAVQVVFYALAGWQEAAKSAASSYRRPNLTLEAQRQEIADYGVDPTTGNVRIPIDKAIELVAAENQTTQPDASDSPTDI